MCIICWLACNWFTIVTPVSLPYMNIQGQAGLSATKNNTTKYTGVNTGLPEVKAKREISRHQLFLRKPGRIIGGEEAEKHEFPSIVYIDCDRSTCGGVILTEEWVLTAAHCAFDGSVPANRFIVYAGAHDLNDLDGKNVQSSECVQIKQHCHYNPEILKNDIALFKVKTPFQYNAYVKRVNLPSTNQLPSGLAVAAGWGKTKPEGQRSPVLKKVSLPILSNNKCKQRYPVPVLETNICAGGYDEGGQDTCEGDSGGPLYFNENNRRVVIGLTSHGAENCGEPDFPAVYTRIDKYFKWIKMILNGVANPDDDCSRDDESYDSADEIY